MELLKRVATAAVLLPVALWVISQGGLPWQIFLCVFTAVCMDEWFAMTCTREFLPRLALAVLAGALFWIVPLSLDLPRTVALTAPIFLAVGFIGMLQHRPREFAGQISMVIMGLAYVLPGVWSAYLLRQQSLALVIAILAIVWITDSGAYFAGKIFGRHKMIPAISAGKTWEGFAGGSVAGLIAGAIIFTFARFNLTLVDSIAITLITTFVTPLGDLLESWFKRLYGVKDSGFLLPGHGGFLDRLDSILAVFPCVLLYVYWLRF